MSQASIRSKTTLRNKDGLLLLVVLIVLLAGIACINGIYSSKGPGPFAFQSIRGKAVTIHGYGLYRDMSAEVAPQGIAQDHISFFLAIPLLIISCLLARKGSLPGKFLCAGTLGYFVVTYGFYTVMAMYNKLFIVYVALMGLSFYAFLMMLFSFDVYKLKDAFRSTLPVKWTGSFMLFLSVSIALLWLNIILPPLFDGTYIPVQVEHYTTLIVQGLDLGILLPAAIITAILLIRQRPLGFLFAPVYLVFLSLLMTALTAKVIAMSILGYGVMPVIIIIPLFNLLTIVFTIIVLNNIKSDPNSQWIQEALTDKDHSKVSRG